MPAHWLLARLACMSRGDRATRRSCIISVPASDGVWIHNNSNPRGRCGSLDADQLQSLQRIEEGSDETAYGQRDKHWTKLMPLDFFRHKINIAL